MCAVFAPSLPYATVFFPLKIASRHCDQLARRRETTDVSFQEFKGKKKIKKSFLCAWMVGAERLRKTLRDIWKLIYKTSCIVQSMRQLIYWRSSRFRDGNSTHVKRVGGFFYDSLC